jgi:hypothetical protein
MIRTRHVAISLLVSSAAALAQTVTGAHFHHLHLNVTDPAAAIAFYTSKFDCETGKFAGLMDAVWAQKSWILFTKVNTPAPSEVVSAIWHMGWGAEDMKAAYQIQVDSGTKFQTPITDISDIAGGTQMGSPSVSASSSSPAKTKRPSNRCANRIAVARPTTHHAASPTGSSRATLEKQARTKRASSISMP